MDFGPVYNDYYNWRAPNPPMADFQVQAPEQFKYRVKIINPKAKKESMVIDWHGVTEKFLTVAQLKDKLSLSLGMYLPPSDELNVGYYHGRPQLKSWILSEDDLHAMYSRGNKEVLLWCDGKSEKSGKKRKKSTEEDDDNEDSATTTTKRAKTAGLEEKELEENIHELQSIHADKYDYGQYRLWGRMIMNEQWKDYSNPPNIPLITGKNPQRGKTDLASSIATAAVAVVQALKAPSLEPTSKESNSSIASGMSPGKKVELRSKYISQLKDIHKLKDEGVLTPEEFQIEKDTILKALKGFK